MKLKTHLIEPRTHNKNTYTVFDMEPRVWSSDFRLANVGSTASADTHYLPQIGVLGLIHDVHIMQDRVLIDRLRDNQKFMAFKQLLKSNRNNTSVQKQLLGSNWGFESAANDVEKLNDKQHAVTTA